MSISKYVWQQGKEGFIKYARLGQYLKNLSCQVREIKEEKYYTIKDTKNISQNPTLVNYEQRETF